MVAGISALGLLTIDCLSQTDEMRETDLEEAGEALAGGLRNIWAVVAPSAAAKATAAAADASVEETAAADTAAEVEPGQP